MKIQGFRGNCDSKGKLGMCPSLAEPDSGGFPRNRIYENHVLINPQNAYRNNAFGMRFFICNFSEKLLDKSQNLCYNQSTV